ncbi:MarR family transcriptional regulator [Algiphilus sp. W345]|uniref:MarR family transcriptional regulator n=1 Tax=Banduia mediterranea TaxID=3075609 RepID=A0ABU2WJL5_9GAMM|nr:MarR family transcriptional regulator [Algiphilus sp. W345]MDT0498060.1 MarR family transcriptional regulator [Algiphilus sp. W345]
MTKLATHISIMVAGIDRVSQLMPGMPKQLMVLARLILIISRRFEERLAHELAPHRLNQSELITLMFLCSRPDGVSTPGELCAVTWESTSNMTRIGNALIGRGLIVRKPSRTDRRRVMIGVTPSGRRFVQRLVPTMFPVLEKLFGNFSAAELARLNRLLIKLAGNVDCLYEADSGNGRSR